MIPMTRGPELGFKTHHMRVGDGRGGWNLKQAEFQFLHAEGDSVCPYTGPVQMDNGELILLAVLSLGHLDSGSQVERPAASFSKDRGETWSDWHVIPDAKGRPTMLADLGGGKLACSAQPVRYFSNDYGRTWSERTTLPPGEEGGIWGTEGSPLIDRDQAGNITLAEVGWSKLDGWPEKPLTTYLRWSSDGGRTWTNQTRPEPWQWTDTFERKTYPRGTSEGSLIRADNGWIVAGLRMDMPARWIAARNDNYCGFGTSISKDNGKTWSPIKAVHHGGRMHGHFVKRSNGDLLLIYIMRQDIDPAGLHYASYRRGCGALVSHDHGLTWDVGREYRLHEFDYATESQGISALACGHIGSTLLDDGSILTAYGHYLSKGAAMIRWRPE